MNIGGRFPTGRHYQPQMQSSRQLRFRARSGSRVSATEPEENHFVLLNLTCLFCFTAGAVLAGGGLELAWLGGSPYYLVSGGVFLLTTALLLFRQSVVLTIFAAFVLGSLAWALWEVGTDWWQLAPRGGVVGLTGLWLLAPWIRHNLGARGAPSRHAWPLAFSVALSLCVGIYAMMQDPYDLPGMVDLDPHASAADVNDIVSPGEWPHYGRTLLGQRFSPLAQITPGNIRRLKEVWRYRTGDLKRPGEQGEGSYQVTPLKVANNLYICTPHNLAIALDATSGAEQWRFDASKELGAGRQRQTCRGVAYYSDDNAPKNSPCRERILFPTSGGQLVALDAGTGKICPGFARGGVLSLNAGMPYARSGFYYITSPPVIAGDKIIIGGAVSDSAGIKAPSGVIRAFDIHSGALLWNWDSGNPDDTAPLPDGHFYTANSPNSWSVFSVDSVLGMVYVPLGNQVPDQLGMNRSTAVETFSSSIVALDIANGHVRWVRQTVHHDLWDMDVPAQPALLTLTANNGTAIPALVAATKQGDIYLLDRRTGEPLLPLSEVAAPSGAVKGDFTAATQPASALSFSPPALEERGMWGITMFDQLVCRITFRKLRYQGMYTPPSLEGTIVYPGNFGVFNWGSIAIDPERQVMFGMPTYIAFVSRLVPHEVIAPKGQDPAGERGLIRNVGAAYAVHVGPFLGPLGIPCQAPPWGYVAAADLRTGKIAYRHINGTVYDATPLPLPFRLGVPGIGGPIITRGGVVFLAGAIDNYLRAYDVRTGQEIWHGRLPAGGQATPVTYLGNDGRQFVVIVAGGHGLIGTKPGDFVIAYALADGQLE